MNIDIAALRASPNFDAEQASFLAVLLDDRYPKHQRSLFAIQTETQLPRITVCAAAKALLDSRVVKRVVGGDPGNDKVYYTPVVERLRELVAPPAVEDSVPLDDGELETELEDASSSDLPPQPELSPVVPTVIVLNGIKLPARARVTHTEKHKKRFHPTLGYAAHAYGVELELQVGDEVVAGVVEFDFWYKPVPGIPVVDGPVQVTSVSGIRVIAEAPLGDAPEATPFSNDNAATALQQLVTLTTDNDKIAALKLYIDVLHV